MNRAQLIIFGGEGRLTAQLQELAQKRALWLREVRHAKTCLSLISQAGAAALVLKLGTNLEREIALLAQIKQSYPETAVVVVGDTEHPDLAGLCWDLGASYVLFPPDPLAFLNEVVASLFPEQ